MTSDTGGSREGLQTSDAMGHPPEQLSVEEPIERLTSPGLSRRHVLAGLGVMGGLGLLGLEAFSVLGIPAALAWGNYDNGRIPTSALTSVQGSYLKPDAATAFNSLASAFRSRFNKGLSLTEGYRDFAQQQYRYELSKSGGPLAAFPGTSNHGWATAVDLGSGVNNAYSIEFNWMRSNAPAYGWNWPQSWAEAAGEFWHWEFVSTTTPPLPQQEDEDMKVYANIDTNAWALAGPNFWFDLPDSSLNAHLTEVYGDIHRVPDAAFKQLKGVYSPYKVYANATTGQHAVGGPGAWIVLTSADVNTYIAKFGTRVAVSSTEYATLARVFSA